MTPLLPLLLLLACGPKEIPAHLRPDLPEPQAGSVELRPPTTIDEAATQLVGGDPLVRRADPRPAEWFSSVEDRSLAAWVEVARQERPPAEDWHALEAGWRGTLAVPLSRGARLAAIEVELASPPVAPLDLLVWAAPVVGDRSSLPATARPALSWLDVPSQEQAEALLHVAERSVLLGWLDAPGLPVSAPVGAFRTGIHDRLVTSPTGLLLTARATGAHDSARAEAGHAALQQATRLALLEAAADRDREQAGFATALDAARTGVEDRDPIGRLLNAAVDDLTADAGTDRSAGAALVALTASRLRGTCPDAPCTGLDRVGTLEAAARWGAATEASLWQVIALKRSLDRIDVARERPSFHRAMVDLSDTLLGTSTNRIDARLLLAGRPDAAVWLALSRRAGGADGTDWEDARTALGNQLAAACERALSHAPEASFVDAVERIQRRVEAP